MSDPKAAPLAEDLRDFALSLPTTVFPKNFFCALCNQLAVDSWKLLCCNKVICSSCQSKLQFPTTCPSCDHLPLEADSCSVNKALRNTMKVWLEKRKKKEDAKIAAQTQTAVVESVPDTAGESLVDDELEKLNEGTKQTVSEGNGLADLATAPSIDDVDATDHPASATGKSTEDTKPDEEAERRQSISSQRVMRDDEPSVSTSPDNGDDRSEQVAKPVSNPTTANNMQGQMDFGYGSPATFNNGMNWNSMNNMMNNNAGWNDMNQMGFHIMNGMSNGMYGNFGGNMSMNMNMNDMSAMNMINYGGGYGGSWNGMNSGFGNGNFNGHNQMSGFNQAGAYPDMMNPYPQNNFSNQNQNRLYANQGMSYPQRANRNGSFGGDYTGDQKTRSRPRSQNGPTENNDGPSSLDLAHNAHDDKKEHFATKIDQEDETANGEVVVSNDQQPEKDCPSTDHDENTGDVAQSKENKPNSAQDRLNPIQTVDSFDSHEAQFNQSVMSNGMPSGIAFPQGMMDHSQTHAHFGPQNGMSFHSNSNFGPNNGFHNSAYGATTLLTGQGHSPPTGVGVVGAPTGPRAMREGRPNTGFQSRMNNSIRFNPTPKPVALAPFTEKASGSPQRRMRSRSPQRDESLRVKQRSPSLSHSRSRSPKVRERKSEHPKRSRSAEGEPRHKEYGHSRTSSKNIESEPREAHRSRRSSCIDEHQNDFDDRHRGERTRDASTDSDYRNSRRDKEKGRSSRSRRDRSRDRSRERRHRHRSRSPAEEEKYDRDNGKENESSSRRKHRSSEKLRHRSRDQSRERSRDRDRDRERDRRERKERNRDHDHEHEKDRSREKDKERRRRREREADDEREYDEEKHFSRRDRKDRDREREKEKGRDRDGRAEKSKAPSGETEGDVVSQMMEKRQISPPLNAPTGPSANGFSIKGRSKTTVMPPPIQPPTGPRALQPPKGPAAERKKDRRDSRDHQRKSSVSSILSSPATPVLLTLSSIQDHYATERERNARERNSREKVDKTARDAISKSLHSRIHSSSRPKLSSKRSRDDAEVVDPIESHRADISSSPKAVIKPPTGPSSHRDKRRKSGAGGDDNIANLFTAGLRKNAGRARRGGVRTEGEVEREMERAERVRDSR